MAYNHGIRISEAPTGIVPPVTVDSAMPVAFVTAPVHLSEDPYGITNVPKLCYTYGEAVRYFGMSLKESLWNAYTAPQVIYSQFVLYGTAPIVIINVLDPKKHKEGKAGIKTQAANGAALIETDGVLLDTVKITIPDDGDTKQLAAGEDYTLAFDDDGFVVIHLLKDEYRSMELTVAFDCLDPEKVTAFDFIGGYDTATGEYRGRELLNQIYPRFRLAPGQLLAPKYSMEPALAAVMETKAANINGHFRCVALNDLPTAKNNAKLMYTDLPEWKTENNYVSERQINCWPKVTQGGMEYYLSTQLAGLICATDSGSGGKPYASPSNRVMKIDGLCYEGGEELVLSVEQANYLNVEGIVTAINFARGWTAWGNRTGCYPGNTDVKEAFIPIRRMFDWIGNTITLTFWNKVDSPMNRRQISTIVNSVNMWLNGLAGQEYILGGRVEFVDSDNPATQLIDGKVVFHVMVTPPGPMEDMEFILEYDPEYLKVLFN